MPNDAKNTTAIPETDPWFDLEDAARRGIAQAHRKIAECHEDIKKFEEVLANFAPGKRMVSGELTGVRPVLPNEYRGKTPVQALESYMRARQGVKIPLSRAVQDLIAGGAEPGKPRRGRTDPADLIAQNIKIALAKSKRLYEVEPEGSLRKIPVSAIMISLAPTASIVKTRPLYGKK